MAVSRQSPKPPERVRRGRRGRNCVKVMHQVASTRAHEQSADIGIDDLVLCEMQGHHFNPCCGGDAGDAIEPLQRDGRDQDERITIQILGRITFHQHILAGHDLHVSAVAQGTGWNMQGPTVHRDHGRTGKQHHAAHFNHRLQAAIKGQNLIASDNRLDRAPAN
jgi:hypothetical protein